jgi:hypothetical protein
LFLELIAMRALSVFVAAVVFSSACVAAEQRWKSNESVDDINNTQVRTVAVVAEDGKSVLLLHVEEGKKSKLMLIPKEVMFPDKTDMEAKRMHIEVALRSTKMEKPVSGLWVMPWMDYKTAGAPCSVKAAKEKIFAGESVTVELSKTGKRYKFPTKGQGCEGLQEAVAKAVEIAAADETAAK